MIELLFNATPTEAAALLGITQDALEYKRLRGDIPPHVYTKFSHKMIRFCLILLRDWQLSPNDPIALARSIALLESTRLSSLTNLNQTKS